MAQQSLPVSETVQVYLRGHGSMRITGWDRAEITLEAGYFNPLRFEQQENSVRVNCMDDCEIFVPQKAQLIIEKISGDARLSNIAGLVVVDRVGGSLSLLQMGEVRVTRVSGDLRAKEVTGALQFERIGGSMEGLDLHAGVLIENISGDLELNRVSGPVTARSGGAIRLGLEPGYGPEINLRASSDIFVHLPQNAGGNFTLSSSGQSHNIVLGGRVNIIRARDYQFSQGAGAEFTLRSGGNIVITDQPVSDEPSFERRFSRLEERINNRIRSQLQAVDKGADIAERAARMAEDAVRRAEERLQAALRSIDRPMDFSIHIPRPPAPPDAPTAPGFSTASADARTAREPLSEPVTDEERLLILRMLQDKKITVEQAEELMNALEDREQDSQV